MAIQTFVSGQVLTAAQVTAVQSNQYNQTVSTKTASYVLVAADVGTRVVMNAAGATTITVNTSLFSAGDTLRIHNIGAGACTITAGTATVNSSTGSLVVRQYDNGELYFTSAAVAIFFPSHQASFGFSTMQLATSTTAYVLTVSDATATGMSVSFTALASRNYKITYYEPEIKMTNTGIIILTIRRTSGTPAQLQGATISSPTLSGANYTSATVTYVGTFSAGTVTLTGTASTTNTGATPQLDRTATYVATLLVEDIGPA